MTNSQRKIYWVFGFVFALYFNIGCRSDSARNPDPSFTTGTKASDAQNGSAISSNEESIDNQISAEVSIPIDEELVTPFTIADFKGTHTRCEQLTAQKPASPDGILYCRVENKDNNHVNPGTLGISSIWAVDSNFGNATLDLSASDNPEWDVKIIAKTGNVVSSSYTLDKATIKVTLKDANQQSVEFSPLSSKLIGEACDPANPLSFQSPPADQVSATSSVSTTNDRSVFIFDQGILSIQAKKATLYAKGSAMVYDTSTDAFVVMTENVSMTRGNTSGTIFGSPGSQVTPNSGIVYLFKTKFDICAPK